MLDEEEERSIRSSVSHLFILKITSDESHVWITAHLFLLNCISFSVDENLDAHPMIIMIQITTDNESCYVNEREYQQEELNCLRQMDEER